MLGFSFLIGVRSYFSAGTGLSGLGAAGMAMSGLLFMIAIVNRGIASGAGDGVQGYGLTIIDLFLHYGNMLLRRATRLKTFGPLECLGVMGMAASSIVSVWSVLRVTDPKTQRDS